MRRIVSNLAIFLLISIAALAQHGTATGAISGQLRVRNESYPPEQVVVKLESRGQLVNTSFADGEGTFSFSDLPNNAYTVIIDDPRYQPVSETVVMNLPFSPPDVHLSLTLSPVKPDSPDAPRISGSNRYMVNLSEMEKSLPKGAQHDYDKALDLDRSGKPAEAIKLYKRVLERSPKFYPARNNLGTALTATGDYGEAEQAFVQVIKENPSDPNAYLNLGNLYLLTKHLPEARHALQVGLGHDPNSAFGHFIMGALLEKSGDTTQSEHELRRALELDPAMARAHLELVNLYLSTKRPDQARQELRTFLQRFPTDPLASQAKRVLAKLDHEN